jgi:dTDP-4-dehydrorhamnose reductase
VYGDGADNYVAKVLAAARSGGPLRFAMDEIASPTSAGDLAEAIAQLIDASAPAGIYHLTNSGEASRYEWAREIIRLAGVDVEITPVSTEELRASGYAGPRKPPYSTLANTRAAALGITLRPWREALAAHLERLKVRG